MRFPWVRREKLDHYRRLYNEGRRVVQATTAANDVLTHQLDLCQRERLELQQKLLRIGFGLHPFEEVQQQQGSVPTTAAPSPDTVGQSFADLPYSTDPQQVMEHFIREGHAMYGGNLRAIKNHVEQRQAQFYAGRLNPIAPSAEEAAAAAQVAADLEAAVNEGRREAERT